MVSILMSRQLMSALQQACMPDDIRWRCATSKVYLLTSNCKVRYVTYGKCATEQLTGVDVSHLSCLSRQAIPMLYAMIVHEVQIMLGCCP